MLHNGSIHSAMWTLPFYCGPLSRVMANAFPTVFTTPLRNSVMLNEKTRFVLLPGSRMTLPKDHKHLTGIFAMEINEAAKTIGIVIGRSDLTVREWITIFNQNNGSFPDTLQGNYQ